MNSCTLAFVVFFSLLVCTGGTAAQSTAESRVERLEESIRLLERRIASLEEQVRQRNVTATLAPEKAAWRRLERGMSQADVEKILGSPARVNASVAFTIWTYGESTLAHVTFDSGKGTVVAWREP